MKVDINLPSIINQVSVMRMHAALHTVQYLMAGGNSGSQHTVLDCVCTGAYPTGVCVCTVLARCVVVKTCVLSSVSVREGLCLCVCVCVCVCVCTCGVCVAVACLFCHVCDRLGS